MNSFTDSFQEFCVDFEQRYIPFWSFRAAILQNVFQLLLVIQVQGFYVILHVHGNCLRTLKTESLNTFINDIPSKIIEHH